MRILYWLFALTAIIGGAVSVFSNDPEQGVWSGLFVSLLIYGIAHYLFLKPSRFLVDVRDGSKSKHVNIPPTSYNDQRDNLFEFRISSNVETKTPNKSAGVWIGSEETIIVCGKTISKGLFYFGGQLKSLGGYGMEASLVDGMLPIEIKALNYADPSWGCCMLDFRTS